MHIQGKQAVVVLGTMSKMPVAGIVFITIQYLIGLKRLGFDVYYVEAHARTPSMLMKDEHDDASALAAAFIGDMMRRFDLGADHWAFHALHDDGRCHGLSEGALKRLYRDAALIFNLHGATIPRPEHYETGRLVYVGTDPVEHEVDVHNGVQETIEYLEPHSAFFTWGENHGNPDCGVPVSERFKFIPTRQPIVMDLWEPFHRGPADTFTTVGNWRQPWRPVTLNGELYHWSKHLEFLKFIDLPRRCGQPLELALSSLDDDDQRLLDANGWRIRESLGFTTDVDAYREYIGHSRGEFTVAKDQNIRLRSGWFSDRSASYLACGRPVVTQETGFSNILPTGEGLFAFSTMEEIEEALGRINEDYERHCGAASRIAREWFDYHVVLPAMLEHLDCKPPGVSGTGKMTATVVPADQDVGERPGIDRSVDTHAGGEHTPFPADLALVPVSRWPTTLPDESLRAVLGTPLDQSVRPFVGAHDDPHVSIVMVTFDGLVFSRLCLESLLATTCPVSYEVVVVDNGSTDGTNEYLVELERLDPRVHVRRNGRNAGFAAATNAGVALARGEVVVFLNNDTIVPEGSLERIVNHLADPRVGLLGAVTNRAGNEAEIETQYTTFGELQRFARDHIQAHLGEVFDIRTVTMFCAALRREVWDAIGPLDERFEVGLFEDDDYAMRARQLGYRVVCAEDVFVHHFGQGSIGRLGPTGQYGQIYHANRARWEAKWGVGWQPYERREKPAYRKLVERIRRLVCEVVPPGATVAVISKGDGELLKFEGRRAWHFPQGDDGTYAGHYPASSEACIAELERLRYRGAEFLVIPATAQWWLRYYGQFGDHLQTCYRALGDERSPATVFALSKRRMSET
jgi:GT2 family glycosyltransferase